MPDDPAPPRPPAPKSTNDWLGAILGVILMGYGAWQLIQSGGTSNLGPFLILLGIAFQPFSIVSIIGGVGLLIWAAWWTFFKAHYPMDYLYTAIAAIVGLGAILERSKGLKRAK